MCVFRAFGKSSIKIERFNIFQIGFHQNSSNTFLYHWYKIEHDPRTLIEQLTTRLTWIGSCTILREIISYIYANPIRKSWLAYLDELCKRFHSMMIERLPDYIPPKVHFITEYPRSIEKYGFPMGKTSHGSLTLERVSDHIILKNFPNTQYSSFKRHQICS